MSANNIGRASLASKAGDNVAGRALSVLLISSAITAILYFIPQLHRASYPLVYLSTMVHELGHGLGAIITGGSFHKLALYSDASGVAWTSGSGGALQSAIVSAGGLVGPAIAAAIGFVAARKPKSARIALGFVGAFLVLAELLWIRTTFGFVFVGIVAAICLVVAIQTSAKWAQLVLVFLSVQLAFSVYSRGDYLFTESAMTGNGPAPSDVSQMASALFGPYWLWGIVCAAISAIALFLGVFLMLRGRDR